MELKDFPALMNEYEIAKKMYAIDCMCALKRIVDLRSDSHNGMVR